MSSSAPSTPIIKTPEQIEGIRRAGALSVAALKHLKPFIKPGITTQHLDRLCNAFLRQHHALPATLHYNNFPASCCTSVNDVVCHGVPNGKTYLKEGDIINVDVTAILDGYFGDTCVMFKVGKVSEYASRLMRVAKMCLDEGVKQCFPGNKLSSIGKSIEKLAHENQCSVVFEFCGHGVGLKFHEAPEVSHTSDIHRDFILKPGMVFTIEPMINAGKARTKVDKWDGWTARTIDGKLSAQYEHTICITENGPDLLTAGMEDLVEF